MSDCPRMGCSLPFYPLHCNAGAALAAPKQTYTGSRKNKVMTIATAKTPPRTARKQRAPKSMHDALAATAALKPLDTEKTAPSQEAIGIKAYEIWMSRGQEQGQDQKHWFEAERQLRV